jgi:hypothetical protein
LHWRLSVTDDKSWESWHGAPARQDEQRDDHEEHKRIHARMLAELSERQRVLRFGTLVRDVQRLRLAILCLWAAVAGLWLWTVLSS